MIRLIGWLDRLLGGFRWYRSLCGGHWEKWYVVVADVDAWFQTDGCHEQTGRRPMALCFKCLVCEDHGEWLFVNGDWR